MSRPNLRRHILFTTILVSICLLLVPVFVVIPFVAAVGVGGYVGFVAREQRCPLRRCVLVATYFGAPLAVVTTTASAVAFAILLHAAGFWDGDDITWAVLWIALGTVACTLLSGSCAAIALYVKGSWFRFRVRTLLVAVLFVCISLAWLGVRYHGRNKVRSVVAELREHSHFGHVTYCHEKSGRFEWTRGRPRSPEWFHDLIGQDFFDDVGDVAHAFFFWDATLDERTIELLQEFPNLKSIEVKRSVHGKRQSAVTDSSLENLATLPNLEVLRIAGAQITDAGLLHLQSLKNLKYLDLSHTPISDAGIAHLRKLWHLEVLSVADTQISEKGIQELKEALRRTEIVATDERN